MAYFLWYYMYLSFIDWSIHRYILHSTSETNIRRDHRIHHLAHKGEFYSDVGLTFSYLDGLTIAIVSSVPILILFTVRRFNPWWIVGHIIGIMLGVKVHNYIHTLDHQGSENWWSKHHMAHHQNPRINFCTTFLGFDYLAGTF